MSTAPHSAGEIERLQVAALDHVLRQLVQAVGRAEVAKHYRHVLEEGAGLHRGASRGMSWRQLEDAAELFELRAAVRRQTR